MNNATGIVIAVLVAVFATIGAYELGRYVQFVETPAPLTGSAAGSTFNSAKIMATTVTTATDTQMAILNTDSSDRTISSVEVFLAGGAATSSLYSVQCATSSVATGFNGNTNFFFNSTFPVTSGTTTGGNNFFIATSSGGIISTSTSVVGSPPANYANNFARIVPAGTYAVCKSVNSGTSQNNLFDPSMTGTIKLNYTPQ